MLAMLSVLSPHIKSPDKVNRRAEIRLSRRGSKITAIFIIKVFHLKVEVEIWYSTITLYRLRIS